MRVSEYYSFLVSTVNILNSKCIQEKTYTVQEKTNFQNTLKTPTNHIAQKTQPIRSLEKHSQSDRLKTPDHYTKEPLTDIPGSHIPLTDKNVVDSYLILSYLMTRKSV